MSEYSYFRAEGRSLEAINTVTEAKEQIREISRKIAKDYGAHQFKFYQGKDGKKDEFLFDHSGCEKIPDDFTIDDIDEDPIGLMDAFFTCPKPGTVAEFNIASQAGAIALLRERNTLERVFGCGEMPIRKYSAGIYSAAFVRSQSYICEWHDDYNFNAGNDRDDLGKIRQTSPFSGSSNGTFKVSDSLDFKKLDGNYYIRVPNDEEGKPHFLPPDSKPMKYKDMLKADLNEFYIQHPFAPRPAPAAKKPSGP